MKGYDYVSLSDHSFAYLPPFYADDFMYVFVVFRVFRVYFVCVLFCFFLFLFFLHGRLHVRF